MPGILNAGAAAAHGNQRHHGALMEGRAAALWHGLCGDIGQVGPLSLVMRTLRRVRILTASGAFATLAAAESFAAHATATGEADPLFFLAQRHYLARDLPPLLRLAAAARHYGHEERAFTPAYRQAVYRDGGLSLWQADAGGCRYAITLEPGQDVMSEGGASLVLRTGGTRICVLSFSLVPAEVADPGGLAGLPADVHFVTRKQLTADRAYQDAFHRAFDRVTPGHLCFAALQGLVLAEGRRCVVGIAPAAHPVHSSALAPHLETAYAGFWATLGARPLSERGVLIPLPVALPPLEAMEPAKRKRALARRGHLQAVAEAAEEAIRPLLTAGG